MRTEVIFLPFSDFVKCTDRLSHLLTFTLDLHATLSVSSVLVNINHKHSIPSYSLSSFCLCLSVCLRQLTEAVGLPDDDSTKGLTPLPPQRDLQKRTVSLYLYGLL